MASSGSFSKGVTRRVTSTLEKTINIVLGIEVDPTGGFKTAAEIALGKGGGGDDPFDGYSATQSLEFKGGNLKKEGNVHFKEFPTSTLNHKVVRMRGCKTNALESYNKKNGTTNFRSYLSTTEEVLAEIHVFQGKRCLTGGTDTFEKIQDAMKISKPGINRILIRLDKDGTSIKDCIIDGVIHWEDGKEIVGTGR